MVLTVSLPVLLPILRRLHHAPSVRHTPCHPLLHVWPMPNATQFTTSLAPRSGYWV